MVSRIGSETDDSSLSMRITGIGYSADFQKRQEKELKTGLPAIHQEIRDAAATLIQPFPSSG